MTTFRDEFPDFAPDTLSPPRSLSSRSTAPIARRADAMAIVRGTTRTLQQVQDTIAERRTAGHDPEPMARLMLRYGNMTDEARAWLALQFPQHA